MLAYLLSAALYAIVGAPSAGKTSIINELEKSGEIICEESATDVILEEKQKGNNTPWLDPDFEIKVFEKKLERETAALLLADKNQYERVFADRGLLDTLVYLETLGKTTTTEYQEILSRIDKTEAFNRYTAIFFVEPHNAENFTADITGARHEDTEESLKIGELIKKIYLSTGKTVFFVPPHLTPQQRAEFIVNSI